ncbi:hypothetical protein J2046_004377 [Rhizobium petrolearium]|uniref:DUF1476 domain-containing protein n=1 Tax=Neorhizobium petrolearium TaxID=515361 RepID=UPI001AE6B46B|nr:ATPase inhibitor subunit zeta [Neorhizobium petrolearium]MBP1846103.1 hypothetical protein [Neorhizobium petrolearium]
MYALRERGRALEDKFAYDQSFQFRAEARRNKLMGLWAASLLGVADAGGYAQDLVSFTLDDKTSHDIATKLRHDFDAAGIAVTDGQLQAKMHDLLVEVVKEMQAA